MCITEMSIFVVDILREQSFRENWHDLEARVIYLRIITKFVIYFVDFCCYYV